MVDITKCKGEECSLKEKCWRFISPEDPLWQSYFVEVPFENGECKHFWERKHNKKEGKR